MKIFIEAIEDTTGKDEDYLGDFIQEEVTDTDKKAKDKGQDHRTVCNIVEDQLVYQINNENDKQ